MLKKDHILEKRIKDHALHERAMVVFNELLHRSYRLQEIKVIAKKLKHLANQPASSG